MSYRCGGSVSFWCSGLETTVFHVCGLLVGGISFFTICMFWKLTLVTLNRLWNNFGHVLMIEICSVLSGSGCWRMWYTIYENRPHRRHFIAHRLQWSITFLTEYISDHYKLQILIIIQLSSTDQFAPRPGAPRCRFAIFVATLTFPAKCQRFGLVRWAGSVYISRFGTGPNSIGPWSLHMSRSRNV